jgi:muramoyltetrapeptide carboxypeptidase
MWIIGHPRGHIACLVYSLSARSDRLSSLNTAFALKLENSGIFLLFFALNPSYSDRQSEMSIPLGINPAHRALQLKLQEKAMTSLKIPRVACNGEIRIVAPCSALTEEAKQLLRCGVEIIKKRGYSVSVDEAAYGKHYEFAGCDHVRQKSFEAALTDPKVSTIWAARGGYGTVTAVANCTSSQLAACPKWLIGFSDVTAAHVLWQHSGLVSLHAVMGTALSDWTDVARAELFALLQNPANCKQDFIGSVRVRPEGLSRVSGILWGGNLTVLASLVGTTRMLPPIKRKPTILFLEDDEQSYRNHRCLNQLLQSRCLANVVGVIFGQWSSSDTLPRHDAEKDAITMLTELLYQHNIPVIADLPVGHAPSSRPLLLGARATLDLTNGAVQVDMQ